MNKIIEIPDGHRAKIEGNKVVLEPKESENERIQNTLHKIICKAINNEKLPYEEREFISKKVLPYLEKQKEQKPESCDCSRDEESYTNGIHHVLMNPEAYGLIKQKPAEQLGGTFTSYDMAKTFMEGQNYVIAHPEKFGLCKPAEWKEGDEGMLNCIIATLCEESHGGRETNDKMITWLENRLKSLRPQPHWKPYKEQISALERAIIKMHTPSDIGILAELRDNLKKLQL